MDELLLKHKREIKELIAKSTALKKSCAQDKKAKKQVLEQIANLEQELKQAQANEIAEFNEILNRESNEITELTSKTDGITIQNDQQPRKINKAKQRLLKKQEAFEKDRLLSLDEPFIDLKKIEDDEIQKMLESRKLKICEMKADGHCLYYSISHQLSLLTPPIIKSFKELRELAAFYIISNKDDFIAFLDDQDIDSYCAEIKDTAAWGGELEIVALSKALGIEICVLQVGNELNVGQGERIQISFHRHSFGLGYHYNSVVDI